MMTEKFSLSELQSAIRDSLHINFPDYYWVIAEISEMKVNSSGHCYLELIEKEDNDSLIKARAKAVIWRNRYLFISEFFKNNTQATLQSGVKVLVHVSVEYHEVYGLSLIINDIDPSYTIGEMAVRKQMIIRQLEDDGVITMNKELEFPLLPQKIAVISSKNAAGYTDFITHLTENQFGYKFTTTLFETVMQGADTEKGIIASFDKIASSVNSFDVVVIIRGGGSVNDLSWFDNYNIAYYVTQFPLPVITGIGHEKDYSITDMVAYKSVKTPTAAANFLIDCFINIESRLNDYSSALKEQTLAVINNCTHTIESLERNIISATNALITKHYDRLSNLTLKTMNYGKDYLLKTSLSVFRLQTRLSSVSKTYTSQYHNRIDKYSALIKGHAKNQMERIKAKIDEFENALNRINPDKVIARGYSLTIKNGVIVNNINQININDTISTRLINGFINSTVTKKSVNTKNKTPYKQNNNGDKK